MIAEADKYESEKAKAEEHKKTKSVTESKRKRRKGKKEVKEESDDEEKPPPPRYFEPLDISDSKESVPMREFQENVENERARFIRDKKIGEKVESMLLTNAQKKQLSLMNCREVATALDSIWNIIKKEFSSNA